MRDYTAYNLIISQPLTRYAPNSTPLFSSGSLGGGQPPESQIRQNGSKTLPGTQRHQNKAMQT